MAEAILNTTPWFASGQVTSDEARYALAAVGTQKAASGGVAAETGVFPAVNALNVTTVSSTRVQVAPGACAVQTSAGGTYIVTVPSATNVDVTAQATNSRIDLVCVRVLDSEASDGLGQTIQARIRTVEGTAASSPSVPSTPSGYLVIAQLLVNSSGITVTDRRQYTSAAGGVRLASAQDTRNGAYPGHVRTWPDGKMEVWTGAAWLTVVAPAAWTQANVSYTFAGGGTPGTVNFGPSGESWVRYKLAGKDLTVRYWAKWGGGGYNGGFGAISTVLPAGFTAAAGTGTQYLNCHLWVNDISTADIGGQAFIFPAQNVVRPQFLKTLSAVSGIDNRWYDYQVAASQAAAGTGIPLIGGGYPQGGNLSIWGTIEVA